MNDSDNQSSMTKRELYEKQVETLKLFLEKHAISQAQFDKSYQEKKKKMGFAPLSGQQ